MRSLEDESAALRSALGARGIRLSDVVTYARTFNGFAATVRTGDLADLPSLGVTAQPVRRFYPATAEPAQVPGVRPPDRRARRSAGRRSPCSTPASTPGHPLLANRLDPGYDAVDRDDDPAPAGDPRGGRRETSGTALAGILVAAGERVLPIRVAGLQPATQGAGLEDVAISDQLLAGLERAVDPDGDGATDDHVPIAVVGVNSPYAGFERLAGGARGRGAPRSSARSSSRPPAARARPPGPTARSARRPPRRTRSPSPRSPRRRPSPTSTSRSAARTPAAPRCCRASRRPGGLTTAGPVDATDPAELLAEDAGSLRGRLVVVRAGRRARRRAPPPRPPRARAPSCWPTRATARCRRSRPAASPRRCSA